MFFFQILEYIREKYNNFITTINKKSKYQIYDCSDIDDNDNYNNDNDDHDDHEILLNEIIER
jgi:hypothetical protein